MFNKDFWDGVKAFFDALKIPLIVLTIFLIYLFPQEIKGVVDRSGYKLTKASILGAEFVEKTEEASANLDGIADKLSQMTAALAARDAILEQVGPTLGDPALVVRADQLVQEGKILTASAQATTQVATAQAAKLAAIPGQYEAAAQATQAVPPPVVVATPNNPSADTGGYLIVFGADPSVASAKYEVDRVRKLLPDADLGLFKKGNFYRSAAIFADAGSRDDAVQALREAVGRTVETVQLDGWCPNATPAEGSLPEMPIYLCTTAPT